MPIEFTCPGCTSRHAFAEHMAGRQFRCNGCGKILTVPAVSGEAITERPRPKPADPADAGASYADAEEPAGGMGFGLQAALLIIGGGILLVLLGGFCLGFGFWAVPGHRDVIEHGPAAAQPQGQPPDIEDSGPTIKLEAETKK
jgi:hypothetical protein